MPKNKRQKYERVRHLPNVTIVEADASPPSETYPWYRMEAPGRQLIVELGCGKGEYTLALAAGYPQNCYVGIDYKSHRICVGAEEALARGLDNVHFLRIRIERIRDVFRPRSIDAIWLTFPDPHLKNRKAKCRLTAAPFLDAYAELLAPGGRVHLVTDSMPLYRYTRETVLRWGGHVVACSADPFGSQLEGVAVNGPISAYAKAALSRGAAIRMLAFTLKIDGSLIGHARQETAGQ